MQYRTSNLLIFGLLLAGCAKAPPGTPVAANSPNMAEAAEPSGAACRLLTLSDVQNVAPDAAVARPNNALIEQSIYGCGWYPASGKVPSVEVSLWKIDGADDTPMGNAKTLAMGFADPLRSEAQAAVRLEQVDGVGDEAVAIVEKTDAAKGIITTGAILTLRKNGQIATVTSSDLGSHERTAALGELATLGRAIAKRL